jgi:hypothetical protein
MAHLGLDLSHLIGMRSRRELATFREDKGQSDRVSKGTISVSGVSTSRRLLKIFINKLYLIPNPTNLRFC